MIMNPMNQNAPDMRTAGSLTGLVSAPVEPDEPVFLYQRKINGKYQPTTRARVFPAELSIFPVHRVQRVKTFTGGGFQKNRYRVHIGFIGCGFSKNTPQEFLCLTQPAWLSL